MIDGECLLDGPAAFFITFVKKARPGQGLEFSRQRKTDFSHSHGEVERLLALIAVF